MSFTIMRQVIPGMGNVKIRNGAKEISIACDDSCGKLPHLSRSDIRLYRLDTNVTKELWPETENYGTVYASIENLAKAIKWLQEG